MKFFCQTGDDRASLHKCTAVKLPEARGRRSSSIKWSSTLVLTRHLMLLRKPWAVGPRFFFIPHPFFFPPDFLNVMLCFHLDNYLSFSSFLLLACSQCCESLDLKGKWKSCQWCWRIVDEIQWITWGIIMAIPIIMAKRNKRYYKYEHL